MKSNPISTFPPCSSFHIGEVIQTWLARLMRWDLDSSHIQLYSSAGGALINEAYPVLFFYLFKVWESAGLTPQCPNISINYSTTLSDNDRHVRSCLLIWKGHWPLIGWGHDHGLLSNDQSRAKAKRLQCNTMTRCNHAMKPITRIPSHLVVPPLELGWI